MKTNKEPKINYQEIKKFLDENPIAKKVVYGLLIVGGIYVAGRIANGMASAVRGFKNFGSAIKGN
jgi:hypothetical protein